MEFFLAISSALEVFLCSTLRLGMLNGGTCILSELYRCLRGLCRSGLGNVIESNFSLFLWFLWNRCKISTNSIFQEFRICIRVQMLESTYLSIISSISCRTSSNNVNVSKFKAGHTVCGTNDGITLVAVIFTVNPYFLSLNKIR